MNDWMTFAGGILGGGGLKYGLDYLRGRNKDRGKTKVDLVELLIERVNKLEEENSALKNEIKDMSVQLARLETLMGMDKDG